MEYAQHGSRYPCRQESMLVKRAGGLPKTCRVSSPVLHNPAVIEAFAKVPREHYLGNGPWRIHSRLQIGAGHTSPSAALHEIYHHVLVSLDERRGLNSGLPSLWALVFDHLNIAPGQTVLQVGAAVGYFTAILAELTGSGGRVIAYEIDEELARRAQSNLAHYAQVEVVSVDAAQAIDLPDLDVVVAFAGVTHVPERWLSKLSDALAGWLCRSQVKTDDAS
ncbi:methyltransferase domain-containing protein [Mesorhizobium sp. B2-3-13]|nr:methyltransferase domain-containing protein [Mesorhizobium sp. B2-3-13]